MQLLAMLAVSSFVWVGALVAARMLLLARRTGGLPELLLGSALASITVVTLPCMTLSLGLRVGTPMVQHTIFAVALVPVVLFAACLFAFTAVVFRPASRGARLSVAAACLVASIGAIGLYLTRVATWEIERVVAPWWPVLLIGVFVAGFVWTGLEAGRYHRMLQRRVELGLADPVIANRFFLWSYGALAAAAGTVVVIGSVTLGLRIITHPVPILGAAFAGLSLSASWYLAFFPPSAYCRLLRARTRETA